MRKDIIKENSFRGRVAKLISPRTTSSWGTSIGLSNGTISRIFSEGKLPNIDCVIKISKALSADIDWLLLGDKHGKVATAKQPIERVNEPVARWDECDKEEKDYILKLLEILQAKNKINITAIKQNIDAFYASKDLDTKQSAYIKKSTGE